MILVSALRTLRFEFPLSLPTTVFRWLLIPASMFNVVEKTVHDVENSGDWLIGFSCRAPAG